LHIWRISTIFGLPEGNIWEAISVCWLQNLSHGDWHEEDVNQHRLSASHFPNRGRYVEISSRIQSRTPNITSGREYLLKDSVVKLSFSESMYDAKSPRKWLSVNMCGLETIGKGAQGAWK